MYLAEGCLEALGRAAVFPVLRGSMTHTGFPTAVLNVYRDESQIDASIASGVVLFFPTLSLFLLLLHPQAEINKLSKKMGLQRDGLNSRKERGGGGREGRKTTQCLSSVPEVKSGRLRR